MRLIDFLRENAAFLFAGFLLSFTSSYGQTYFISIFAGVIREDFGLSHAAWGGIYTAGTLASAATMVWAGTLTDRFRANRLGIFVMAGLALACLAMAAVPSALLLIGVIYLLRLCGQGMMVHLSQVSMVRWFRAARGRALSISSMGPAMGQAILPLVFVALMSVLPWRGLWLLAAGLVLLTLPPVLYLLRLERTPQSIANEAQVAGLGDRHWTRGEVVRHPLFWLMVPALLGPPAWGTALFFQQVHLTEVKGWALVDFVALMPLFTAVTIGSNLVSGWLIDRLGAGRLVSVFMLPFAAGFAVLALAPTIPWAALGMVIFGIGQGMGTTVPGAFWAEYFGTRHIGSIKAAAAAIMVLGSAIGPGVSGALIDLGVTFPEQMLYLVGYFLIAAALAALGIARVRSELPATA